MNVCSLLPGPWVSIVGLALDLVGKLLIVCPLFFVRRKDVIRGDQALWAPDPPHGGIRTKPVTGGWLVLDPTSGAHLGLHGPSRG